MTDTQGTGASALLGNDTPSPASEAQISRAEAYAKRDALMRDPVWREAYMKNDPEKVRQMKEVLAGATRFDLNNMGETIAARETVEREQIINSFRRVADIPDAVAEQIRQQTPITRAELKLAEQERAKLMADREFVKRLLSGERAARTRMALVNILLGSPVAVEAK